MKLVGPMTWTRNAVRPSRVVCVDVLRQPWVASALLNQCMASPVEYAPPQYDSRPTSDSDRLFASSAAVESKSPTAQRRWSRRLVGSTSRARNALWPSRIMCVGGYLSAAAPASRFRSDRLWQEVADRKPATSRRVVAARGIYSPRTEVPDSGVELADVTEAAARMIFMPEPNPSVVRSSRIAWVETPGTFELAVASSVRRWMGRTRTGGVGCPAVLGNPALCGNSQRGDRLEWRSRFSALGGATSEGPGPVGGWGVFGVRWVLLRWLRGLPPGCEG